MKLRIGTIGLLVMVLAVSCKTRPPDPLAPEPEPRVKREFQPAQTVSMLKYAEGSYANLFSPETYAVWVDQEVIAVKKMDAIGNGQTPETRLEQEAMAIAEDFIVIECHIVSEFTDMSVAYDAVRYRGIDVYLLTPDGKQVPPIQTHPIGPVGEEPVDAIKRFSRTHIAIFPRADLWVGEQTVDPLAPDVRLVLEGHTSTFFFQWPGGLSETVQKRPLSVEDRARAVQLGFNELYGNIRRLAHIFS